MLFSYRKRNRDRLLTTYAQLLTSKFSFFSGLSADDKRIFLDRLLRFRKTKHFHHLGLEKMMQTEVLVSASAIQITFGLERSCIDFFDDVYIIKDAYTYGYNTVPWAGHVDRKGIHVSWNHFERGYAISNDRNNVGLHEMAHALEYEFAAGGYSGDATLR